MMADGCNVFRNPSWLCADGQFCCECVWLMYSVKPKSTTIHGSSSGNGLPAKTGEAPELQHAADLQLLDASFLSVGLRKSCPSLVERESCQLYLITNCVWINNWTEEGSLWILDVSALIHVCVNATLTLEVLSTHCLLSWFHIVSSLQRDGMQKSHIVYSYTPNFCWLSDLHAAASRLQSVLMAHSWFWHF